ncbi:TNF receptor-associated factor 5-like isoform X1 [Acropora muricata]|uniref:TNF receptor-associated factor 5-like isoform X2 n=1 Tax=Acropora millepora TaxID=45264 RepID=UPI001CF457DB|nr:TNF receptor-associated factor 5-like isoform X2 [Acropora millepora]
MSKSVMVKPVTLPCGHSGCLQCFQTLLMYHESNGKKTAPCPECRISEFGRDSLNVSVALHALTGGLDVQCTNNNCAWKGKFEDAKAHDETCPHRRVNCTNNGCPATMERGQKDTHLAICKKQAVPCTECKRSVARDEMSAHAKFRCIYARSTCPLGCGLNLRWCQIFLHVGQCREKIMRCSVKGCKQMFRRKEWEEHMRACALSHAKLRDGEIQNLRQIIYKKEYNNIPPISLREISTESFQWEVQNFCDYRDGRSLASPSFVTADRLRWRGIWKDSSLFLQLQSAVNPVTARIRVVPMQDLKGAVSLRMTELKEGEIIEVGHEMVTKALENNTLRIKFIVTIFNYE